MGICYQLAPWGLCQAASCTWLMILETNRVKEAFRSTCQFLLMHLRIILHSFKMICLSLPCSCAVLGSRQQAPGPLWCSWCPSPTNEDPGWARDGQGSPSQCTAQGKNTDLYNFHILALSLVHPKMKKLPKMYSPSGCPRCREFVLEIWRNLALHHLLTNGCSAVNGCRQNERPNSW